MTNHESEYTVWERELTDELCGLLEVGNSDAQSFLEANCFYQSQAWGLDLNAKLAAAFIVVKSTK